MEMGYTTGSRQRAWCQILGGLHLPKTVDDDRIRTLQLLAHNVFTNYANKLSNFSEEEYRQLEQLETLFKFLDDIILSEDGEEIEIPMNSRGRKRMAEDGSVGSGTSEARKASKGNDKAKQNKWHKVSGLDDNDDDDELPEGCVAPAPARMLPKRAVEVEELIEPYIGSKAVSVQNIPDDDEEEGEEAGEVTPATVSRRHDARARVEGGNTMFDSIMDSEEEDDGEVL
ncbi:hypothetical protein J3R83DRAFT_5199 [Lanmaoa asiatica]|nr:hypothetical protein J3R83DRAFT_5199 [Lanmaoa asiatica]